MFFYLERSRDGAEGAHEFEGTRNCTEDTDSPKLRSALNKSQYSHEQGEFDLENDVETRNSTADCEEESGIWPPLRSFTRYLRLW